MEGNSVTFDDIRKQWQTEVTRPTAAPDVRQLLQNAQRRFGNLEKTIFWRDVREILAGVLVVCCFAGAWPIFRTSAVASVGVAIIILSTPLIIYTLLAANRSRTPQFTTSVLDFSRQKLAWVDRQIRLLQTVVVWYVAPLFVGIMLAAWGLTPGRWLMFAQISAMTIAVMFVTLWLNRRSVQNDLLPVRRELVELIESLESATKE
jgi:hypothetical protein